MQDITSWLTSLGSPWGVVGLVLGLAAGFIGWAFTSLIKARELRQLRLEDEKLELEINLSGLRAVQSLYQGEDAQPHDLDRRSERHRVFLDFGRPVVVNHQPHLRYARPQDQERGSHL
jgi:hypothetical protein